jgi:ribonucleoside-diphosphate reductase alpha chain
VTIQIQKRSGNREPLQLEKIHRVLNWAAEGLHKVSVSEIELKAKIQFFDGMTTANIHEMLIKSAADLISDAHSDYQYLAARLAVFHLRKQAFGKFMPPHAFDHVTAMVGMNKYDAQLLEKYDEQEWGALEGMVHHERDLKFAYAGIKQLQGKYLVQDRVTGQVYESPQFVYLMIAACLFADYPKETRLGFIKRFYEAASTHRFSLPTPIMAGVRTPTRQFSSCVLIECDDSLESINATTSSIVNYVSQRAGIGINAGRIRGLGSPIRGGEAFHTGCIPFYKLFQAAVKSCSQGGIRGGAATVFFPLWHSEVESLLVLKNNRGVEDNRVRHLDYGVQLNRLMYQRLIQNGSITLFSPSEVPGLYEAFFADQSQFEALYLQYENDPAIRKRSVPAKQLFSVLMQERASTGRVYIQNVDHCNDHGPFDAAKAPIRQSNLCMEITLPTQPLRDLNDEQGEIALCTLAAINLGAIESDEDIDECADLLVRALDALLDYQDYPVKAAERSTMKRRSLGIGVINYAYYLAKHGASYSHSSALPLTHRLFEKIQYALLGASNRLAKEQGACPGFDETKYAQGILPIDRYKKSLDGVCNEPLTCDWEGLRGSILAHGLRNSTLTAQMPSETSAQIANATNGIEPPRALVSIKASKDGILKQVVPEIERLGASYELLWQQRDNSGYLKLVGVMQKFIDQAISANTSYQPEHFDQRKVPLQRLVGDLLSAYKLGIKTLYYHNTRDGSGEKHTEAASPSSCESGACAI